MKARRHVQGCFLNPLHVSRSKRAALSKSSTLTMRHREMTRECMLLVRRAGASDVSVAGRLPGRVNVLKQPQGGRTVKCSQVAARRQDTEKSFSFWIKSSARRAFGECLGSKRR